MKPFSKRQKIELLPDLTDDTIKKYMDREMGKGIDDIDPDFLLKCADFLIERHNAEERKQKSSKQEKDFKKSKNC